MNKVSTSKWEEKHLVENTATVRKLASLVLRIAVASVFGNHCYTFEGEFFLQTGGMPYRIQGDRCSLTNCNG